MAKSNAKSNGSSGRGGKRPGAGRKCNADKKLRDDFNAATSRTLIEWLPRLLANLKLLADGGFERVEQKFAPGPDGPDDLVLVERKVSVAEPDRAANEYLVNRLLGRPTQAIEHTGKDGEGIVVKAYVGFDPDIV